MRKPDGKDLSILLLLHEWCKANRGRIWVAELRRYIHLRQRTIKRSTLYKTIDRLEFHGLVGDRYSVEKPRKRLVWLTAAGVREAKEWGRSK